LTTLGVAVPLALAVGAGHRVLRNRTMDDLAAAVVRAQVPPSARASCEASPDAATRVLTLPAPGGGPSSSRVTTIEVEAHFFDRSGRSLARDAPPVPMALLEEVRGGASVAAADGRRKGEGVRQLLVAMPWSTGPCALALVGPPTLQPWVPPLPLLLGPLVLALVAVLAGIGPVVRRARVLTAAVRRWRAGVEQVPPVDPGADELGELSRAFREAAETIAARERDLRAFVENVSHDLATPLTVLQGHLSSLAAAPDPDVVRQAMNEAHYLGSLLGSLAVTAKFEAGAMVRDALDLRAVVVRVLERHRGMAARLSVELEGSVPESALFASGDVTFTEQALTNLVGNALRHNREGGHVAVVLDAVGGEFSLRVLDDGPGMSDDECQRVLRRGERGDGARERGSAGRGLGLSIVARVAAVQSWRFSLAPGEPTGLVAELRGATVGAGDGAADPS